MALPDDAEALTDLHTDVWEEAYGALVDPEVLADRRRRRADRVRRWRESLTAGPATTYVVPSPAGERLLGFVSVGPARNDPEKILPETEVWALYVRAECYGTGLGHALLRRAVGVAPAVLWVLDGNERAMRFYRRQGFVFDGATVREPVGLERRMVRRGPAVVVRDRRPEDLPVLVELLGRQQPTSRYPFRWPLPFPAEEFLARESEERAWVVTVDDVVAGQVTVTTVGDDDFGRLWRAGTGRANAGLGCVSAFFVDLDRRGLGLGGRLLDTAVAWVREQGRVPVLDVVQQHGDALAIYRHRGWREVGSARPPWLPDDEPPVLAMVLDDPSGQGRLATTHSP
ncbi:ribosomal protein S18 acetylase RimI-like enzyme [Lapillicoccus jejuensis]|uniref:Ribosomal protein S18 acetylase RimI-like enzyme n=1 Tax=Lapillicoccus jejuensis TaxID=402171 RepID=A0A542E529_9MICO|nr:ribosomal protein S18 acetylase RimI-like enzyme [Lapillicoccus jejuensis]